MDLPAPPSLIVFAAGALVLLCLAAGLAAAAAWIRAARARERMLRLDRERLEQQIALIRRRQAQATPDQPAWNGYRKFVVARVVDEAESIRSFYLEPHDAKPLAPFLPGQHLTFQLAVPGRPKPLVRCYSLSAAARPERYRVTIKRVPAPAGAAGAPPGLASNYFHDHVVAGRILDVKAPGGRFYLDPLDDAPLVLLAGGVGITPLYCMVEALVAAGASRETWLFYGVRGRADHALREPLSRLAQAHSWLSLHVCYSDPEPSAAPGVDDHHAGRITPELLREVLPSSNYHFYLCGPPPMMDSLTAGLRAWGVPDERVHFELFGPASVKRVRHVAPAPDAAAAPIEVLFERSGRACAWTPGAGSLLDLAEAHGVAIDAGCRAGNCGTCATAVKAGTTAYATPPGFAVEAGSCLACVAIPAGGRLVVDA